MMGRQGSGKGTQSVRLARHYVVPHISTGDILRASVKTGTEFGCRANKYMSAGKLVPDDVVIGMVQERLSETDTRKRGFILDGFPRTAAQAEALDAILEKLEMPLDLAINIEVPMEEAIRRLVSRRVCSSCGTIYSTASPPKYDWTCDVCSGEVEQRVDDTEDAIRTRLEAYESDTAPLIAWYLERDLFANIDGVGAPDVVLDRMTRAIDHRMRSL
jgi:adenylate kinase